MTSAARAATLPTRSRAKVALALAVTVDMQSNLIPVHIARKAEARAAWLDLVLEQLGAARTAADALGIPGLAARIAQAQADATRLRQR